jgi:hypothetical protein
MRKAVPAEMIMIEVDPEGMNLTDQLKVEVKC